MQVQTQYSITEQSSDKGNPNIKPILIPRDDESQSPIDILSDNCSDDERLDREAAQVKKSQRNEKSNKKIAPAQKPQDSTTNLPQEPTSPKTITQHTTKKPQDSIANLPQKPTSPKPKPRTQYTPCNTIAILGDSMIKMIKPSRLQRSTNRKIIVKTFPGAAVKDMNHYLKPTLENNPEMIVLHVGTNDIPKKDPTDIVHEIESLSKIIVENGSTKVAISERIQREDQVLNTKVKETNILLYQLCSKYKWPIIRHTHSKNRCVQLHTKVCLITHQGVFNYTPRCVHFTHLPIQFYKTRHCVLENQWRS